MPSTSRICRSKQMFWIGIRPGSAYISDLGSRLSIMIQREYWNVFPEREIVSEERNSLIGAFQQGKQENLIVLSDAYFEEVWNQISTQNRENWAKRETISKAEWKFYSAVHEGNLTEGPTMLYCMNVPDGKSAEVAENLEYLKEKHSLDRVWDRSIQPFYERTQMIRNTESEILLARTANGFILLVLVIMAAFQYFLYVKQEGRYMEMGRYIPGKDWYEEKKKGQRK